MMTHVVLLRAVNVGGRGKVAMSALRSCLEDWGCSDVHTLLQSGNIVLRTDAAGGSELEQLLEAEFRKRLHLPTDVIVRSAAQWKKLIGGNPFPREARDDPSHLLAIVAKRRVVPEAIRTLRSAVAAAGGREAVGESRGQVYLYYTYGIGRSRVTTALIERALGTPVTGRNWNTVLKLAEACAT